MDREPKHGKYWRAFRSLFLLVNAYEIPEAYRMPEYYTRWRDLYLPRLSECIALVRGIHDATSYDDDAEPMI